ncbi:hypothetical protein [Rhizobium sp. RCAM05973]|uniref:hypothetical protein n=1 Tax=Rhizobium sp. RCAM05973 TaxID=2994066 RepID=UPI0022EBF3B2|nr:hypothetical protein [Rhizobium sp. RCAM05973]
MELNELEETLLKVQFGDRYDGTITLGQICDLAGITINGEKPVVDEEEIREGGAYDWSGKYVHWSFHLKYTQTGRNAFLADFRREFPGLFINEEQANEARAYHCVVRHLTEEMTFLGNYFTGLREPASEMLANHLPYHDGDYGIKCGKALRLHLPLEVRSTTYLMYNSKTGETDWIERRKHSLEELPAIMAEYGILWPTYDGRIEGSIHAGEGEDKQMRARIERHFGNRIKTIDVDSGEVVNSYESSEWYTRDQIDWCSSEKTASCGWVKMTNPEVGWSDGYQIIDINFYHVCRGSCR